MKGRMFVVNQETIRTTMETQIASIITPDLQGEHWLKTLADIMADMLQIEIGDYIFLWETSGSGHKSRIYGVYRAISKPYYECSSSNDNAPFKIHIEKAYDFENPISEYDVLNCPYIKSSMWTIIGKKVAGKSRGSSPLSQEEIKVLISLLMGKNINYKYYEYDSARVKKEVHPIQIDYNAIGETDNPNSLMSLNPNKVCFFNNEHKVHFEKVLETIFNQEMSNKNATLFRKMGINVNKVVWYSNYLPYSIEQSEMDYVIIESDDGLCFNRIFVIEFQKEKIDEDHIRRCLLYSKWVDETLALGTNVVQPILICSRSYDFINGETHSRKRACQERLEETIVEYKKEYGVKELQIYEYSMIPEIELTRKR